MSHTQRFERQRRRGPENKKSEGGTSEVSKPRISRVDPGSVPEP